MFTIPWDEVFGMLDQHCWSCHPTGLMCNEMYDVSLSLSLSSVCQGACANKKKKVAVVTCARALHHLYTNGN